MRTSRAGETAFIGRARLLSTVRQSVDSGLNVWLKGESGVGKTALARRAAPGAFYVAHCSPLKEVLVSLLVTLYGEGLYLLDNDADDEEEDEEKLRKKFKRLDTREALKSICDGLGKAEKDSGLRPVVIFDEFEAAHGDDSARHPPDRGRGYRDLLRARSQSRAKAVLGDLHARGSAAPHQIGKREARGKAAR